MQDFDDFFSECDRGPRLNQLAGFFTETAAGKNGMPIRKPIVDTRLFPNDTLLHRFVDLHARRQGFFDQHYHSSIPYRLEEECRMAHALFRYAQLSPTDVLLYSLGTAEGTMARTLSELSNGKIQSLSCSPNEENFKCFMAFGEPSNANFFLGPFHRLSKDHLRSDEKLRHFADGFDFILEDTTFQMYSPNRNKQIEFVAHHLKSDGILLLLEKFRASNPRDYQTRESQKDLGFKTRFFPAEEIERKTKDVLTTMHNSEVTLAEMANAVYAQFKHCVITWNSGNFYGLAASNSQENLWRYLSLMVEPAIPAEYVYEPQPYTELSKAADG
ncbi:MULTISPECIES: class I SAM-dependent methyltransferase [unclassified Shinella]|jgi:hypothetical protein|uniref:class I SAM-dependent methyltransferase n=1 Tax=unclassified Shinella TaxID=2643062 RepID=UPI00102D66EF|nr:MULTISPECIES: class I SAM-dependent methyltransferase [unclassified Shinella]MCO5148578.1 class I SAM-dependent methyltransferase [Shinella sp.]MDC7264642.1 class I SAM-dependent methyltransferase [Shinella sp. HY16]MDC7271539.1 class I SAM-dependent methyltransferase [Shinella sp. YZ44]TAA55553.1 class I SAM-dependent methyltransferase [Shinella sp. JR1-6]